jgi:hypothetical protein
MASIADVHESFPSEVGRRLIVRALARVRLWRIRAGRARTHRLVAREVRNPELLADAGINPSPRRREAAVLAWWLRND